MILVTVGAQMPFDRLVRTVDEWAGRSGRTDVFAQIGTTDYRPAHIQWTAFLDPTQFRQKVQEASVLIAHAGMGSIITAMQSGKPILVMPRRGELRETRNDHQVATAVRFRDQGRIAVALDEQELARKLDGIDALEAPQTIRAAASDELLRAVRRFIDEA